MSLRMQDSIQICQHVREPRRFSGHVCFPVMGVLGMGVLGMVSGDGQECLSAWTITASDSGMGNNSEITWISPSRLEGLAKWCQGEKCNLEVL